jgi:Na+-driven multidrug efflux pump
MKWYPFYYDSGTARGVGWQKIGAYINLGSYYLVGIPAAVVLAFVLLIGGKVIKKRTILLWQKPQSYFFSWIANILLLKKIRSYDLV